MGSTYNVPRLLDPNGPPLSTGKMKALWDAVRSAPTQPADPPPPQANIGGVAPDPSVMDSMPNPRMATPAAPSPLAVDASALPATGRLTQLQHQTDAADASPSLKQRLGRAGLLAAVGGIGAAFGAPSMAQGVDSAEQESIKQRDIQRQALLQQSQQAQQAQTQQYDTATNARERAYAAEQMADSRRDVGGMGADSREYSADQGLAGKVIGAGTAREVADTRAGAMQRVAGTRADAQRYGADQGLKGKVQAARIGADARVAAGKYAADTALGRQQRSFDHSDNKPTAAEDTRSDYAETLDHNATEMDNIVQQHPGLVGPIAGRITQLRGALGSNDPNVSTLYADSHNLGVVANATHGIKQGAQISAAAESAANLHNGPEAYHASTAAVKRSADTFKQYTRPSLKSRMQQAPAIPEGADGVYDPKTKKVVYR